MATARATTADRALKIAALAADPAVTAGEKAAAIDALKRIALSGETGRKAAAAEAVASSRAKRLTDKKIAELKAKATRYVVRDPACPGLYVRVMPSGHKSFTIVARDPYGKQLWREVAGARVGVDRLDDVQDKARLGIKRIKAGQDPFPPPPPRPDTFEAVAKDYVKRNVESRGLRSKDEIERILARYVFPAWRDRIFTEIRKRDITMLLDAVEDNSGARQADYVLAVVRGIMSWYETRIDGYDSPVVRKMARTRPAERARERTLSDDELRLIWPLLAERGAFGSICKIALLTAARREKIAAMKWDDLSDEGVWTIATEAREKGNGGRLGLPKMVLDIIHAQAKIAGNAFVFPGRGKGHFNGFSPGKRALDKQIAETLQKAAKARGDDPRKVKQLERWTIHDLRRSAKSLMMRAGIDRFHAERVLGHQIKGVEGTYDRHGYETEKRDALARLAALVELILTLDCAKLAEGEKLLKTTAADAIDVAGIVKRVLGSGDTRRPDQRRKNKPRPATAVQRDATA